MECSTFHLSPFFGIVYISPFFGKVKGGIVYLSPTTAGRELLDVHPDIECNIVRDPPLFKYKAVQ